MSRPFEELDIPLVARLPRPGTVVPGALAFTHDDRAITYLFSEEGSLVRSLWRFDVATGERTVVAGPPPASVSEAGLSREEELRRERARQRELGVTSYELARDADVLLVPSGGHLLVSAGGEPLRELAGIAGAIDPHLSRDGTQVAFVRDGELFVAPVDGSAPPRQLTSGASETVTNGLAEFIAQEELDRSRGFWWSPDGTRIAFVRADSGAIEEYPIVHQGKDGIDIERHRYPFAGAKNAVVQLGVADVATQETAWMDLGPESDIYLARVAWRPGGDLAAQVLSRDQQTLTLLVFDATGAARTLLEEHQEPWINLDTGPRFLESGEFVVTSERTGFRHIFVYDASGGPPRQLTEGEWVVTSILHVDEQRRMCYFTGTRESVLERHVYSVSLDGGQVTRLTQAAGCHSAVFGHEGRLFADIESSRTHAPTLTLRSLDDAAPRVVFANQGNSADALGLAVPEFADLSAEDGTPLHAALYRPRGFAAGRRYPAVVAVYGGPHVQMVADDWSMTVDLRAQYLAEQGFVVLKLDNRGSSGRGLAFEAALARQMGSVEIADQASGVAWLVKQGIADPARVGIYGWSYGGYMTAMALLKRGDVFRVGVAGAPVTDWGGYDTAYTERYMSTPQRNPEGYRDASVLTHAGNLQGRLLIVHGMVDENVHFRHTARFIRALTEAGKDYDLLIFPEERHMPRDQKGLEYQEERVLGYLAEHLNRDAE